MAEETKKRKERNKQKLKILYILKILLEKTDETHDITLAEIVKELDAYGVTAERKSLYSDIQQLRDFGYEIEGESYNRTYHYRIINRQYELAELKLLVDSVQASKFITEKKSNELISKIVSSASVHEAKLLKRQMFTGKRLKTINEKIFYSVDAIHEAINRSKKISFQYFNWSVEKKMVLRHDGARYVMNPLGLSWDDENYYLVAYDNLQDKIKHFRVDKMLDVQVSEDAAEITERYKSFDMAEYTQKMFGMFGGEERNVSLKCQNGMAGVMIDRFGTGIPMIRIDDEHFRANVKVEVSRQFLGWIMSLGEDVTIEGPADVVDTIRKEAQRLTMQYR